MIRWCKSTINIYSNIIRNKIHTILFDKNGINYKYIVGISALRSIIDDLDSETRKIIIKDINSYLPENLYNILPR